MPQRSPKDRNVPRRRFGTPEPDAQRKPAPRGKGSSAATPEVREQPTTERIAKIMARAGACSRRDAETWIEEGRVAVNGEVLLDPAFNVGDDDVITIDGTPLPRRARTRLFRFHKPRGLVSTDHDPEGRPTIFDHLREHWSGGPRVVSVGRLDINTEGLMLLTNDGGLARVLELPSTGWVRRYRVRVNGETDQATLDGLRRGVTIDGVSYAGIEATLDRVQGANCWLTLSLREGKNREVKRVLEHLGLAVNRLIRLSFGPFQLGELAEGAVEEVRTKVLRDQLGPSLAKAAGADFTSPSGEEESVSPPAEKVRREPERRSGQGRRPSDEPRPRPRPTDGPRATARATDAGSRAPTPAAVPKVKPPSRVRKHVSVLRRQEAEAQGGPRKRIERGETADRSGRVVSVERVVAVAPKPAETKGRTRNARHFEALRKGPEGAAERKPRGPKSRASGATSSEADAGSRREIATRRENRVGSKRIGNRPSARPDGQESRHRSLPERTSARPRSGEAAAGRAERRERPNSAAGGPTPYRSQKRAPAKTRTDGAHPGARAERKPAGKRPPDGGHPKGRNRPGSPPRKG